MPKLKQTEKQKQDVMFKAIFDKNLTLCGYANKTQFAPIVGLSRVTLSNKLRNPDTFTVRELRRLYKALKYSPEDKLSVL